MPINLDDFFPLHASWPLFEHSSNTKLVIELNSQVDGLRRHLLLDSHPSITFNTFFDRLTVTTAGLELNRVRVGSQTLDLQPPFVITTGNQVDHTANLFPGLVGTYPPPPPYDGTVVKTVKDVSTPGLPGPDQVWQWDFTSRGTDKQQVYHATFEFSRANGLLSYQGQVYGRFFKFSRTDIPVQPQPPTPHPAPPPPPLTTTPPPLRVSPPTVQKPYEEYHTRVQKEIWDAERDDALQRRLGLRAPDEKEVKEGLVRSGQVPRLKERAKDDKLLKEALIRAGLMKKDE